MGCKHATTAALGDLNLAISSLCAVQSLMYSSCSLDCCFTGARPGGLGEAGAEPLSWATRGEEKGRAWPCLEVWRLEPYSSSEVEAYSTGTRRHRETADRGEEKADQVTDVMCNI